MSVQLLVVDAAERDGEFVADLSPQGLWPGNLEMMRVTRRGLANQARLRGNESEVRLASLADRLSKGGNAIIIS